MPSKSLRSQLNQIRAWVRQGRTDAWIAHQLEVSASELRAFRSQHGLSADDADADAGDIDLRDEIEAEIEAAGSEEDEEPDSEEEAGEDEGDEELDGGEAEGRPRRRRRRGRRGGRGRGRGKRTIEATFDHGDEGYGLWLDPAVQDNSNYSEHWAGHREVSVTIEPEQIVIRRAGAAAESSESSESSQDEE
jgi:hypothetical protein